VAEINYTPIAPGDATTAASLNTPFQAGVAGVNALETYALRPGALRADHLPSVANILGTTVVGEDFLDNLYLKQWDSLAPNNDLVNWDIVVDSTGAQLSLTWTPFKLGMDGIDKYAAILVLVNVHYRRSSTTDSLAQGISDAVISVQFRQPGAGATWWTLNRATRLCSQRAHRPTLPDPLNEGTYQDIPIRALITKDDLVQFGGGGTHAIDGVRVVVAGNDIINALPNPRVRLREGRLTVLRIRSGGLTT